MKFRMIHENYNVSDLDKSLAFYEAALGLKEKRRKNASDGSFIIVYIGNDENDFEMELTWLRDHPQKYDIGEEEFHLAFRTDDFDAAPAKAPRPRNASFQVCCIEYTVRGENASGKTAGHRK